ncbi:hypothetical protein [Pedobacter sp. MW01-1-1]|uniref:hypothetical protein n=1 Tax=Pedobacter sp. MW01-1-1 TaxID=3383027 RepID=UPI003FEF2FD0
MKYIMIFEKKLNELKLNIPYEVRVENTGGILLFKDYLFKMNMWYNRLGISERFNALYYRDEFHNLINLVKPELLDEIVSFEDFKLNYTNGLNVDLTIKSLDLIIVYSFLCWEIFKEFPELDQYSDMPNPYESSINILLRGNHIRRGEMATIEIDSRITIRKQFDFNLPSIDNDFLDFIDSNCLRSGSYGIPNQNEVNKMWLNFRAL